MNEFWQRALSNIGDFTAGLSSSKRLAVLGLSFIIMCLCVVLFLWADHTTYTPLMNNLSQEDATNIIRILRDKHIPFRLDQTGRNISIPSESIYILRLELAGMGLPQSSVLGYEIFDKQQLGTSTFVQKVNQKRAQEGELMRTINSIKGVKHSRVHLATPSKTAFLEEKQKPSASVVVDLDQGVHLTEKQIFGIGNLVARSVEGLDLNDVVIMNSEGRMLSKNQNDPLSQQTATQLEHQTKVESEYEKRIEALLSRVVGDGHVVAKVTADLDFSHINETQTLFDSDGVAIRSVEKHQDVMNGNRGGGAQGAGATANTPGVAAGTGVVTTQTNKNNEVTNYEVPQTIRKTSRSLGTVKRLSVAVVVDGKVNKTKDPKTGQWVTNVQSWTPEQIKEFSDLVVSSVGIDKKRGDTLEIRNIEFRNEDFEEAQRIIDEREQKNHTQTIVTYAVLGLAVLLFFLLVVRPFVKWVVENTVDSVDTFLPQTVEELERIQKTTAVPQMEDLVPILPESLDPNKVEGEMIKEKIITLVENNPHKAALVLRDWLHEHPKDRTVKPEKEKKAAG